MKCYTEYKGMSYEQASREGARLIKQSHETGNWFCIVERLACLKEIMERQFEAA